MKELKINTKVPRYRNHYNYEFSERKYPINDECSEAVPGQAYSLKEILERFTRGQAPQVAKVPMYSGIDDFDSSDITRNPEFDLADATLELKTIEDRKKRRVREEKKRTDITASIGADTNEDRTTKEDEAK